MSRRAQEGKRNNYSNNVNLFIYLFFVGGWKGYKYSSLWDRSSRCFRVRKDRAELRTTSEL